MVQDLYACQQLCVKDCLGTMKAKSAYEHNLFSNEELFLGKEILRGSVEASMETQNKEE